ncbi:hypothetical protein M9H77_17938 [Catharanthus roseus]|uniref:Uncharacterized protein n=1 Tax=Catharanthus roseus TaxID=4058 RepID=A0ACC0B627_CATRO|nr:hypothetical protein M9H77_17938 [Catharanthus roseus]
MAFQHGASLRREQGRASPQLVKRVVTRGRVLGGSRAINAGFYSRADQDFYRKDGINWDLRVVNRSYEWNWQSAVRDGFLEAGIGPYNGFSLDHLVGTKIGGSTFDSTGRRQSTADLLSYAKTSNIRVTVHAIVERVLLATSLPYPPSKPLAIGVVYRDQRGGFHHAMLRDKGEVLLSARALGSPQLLLLSGIRPSAYLSSWGIPVARHHPYVGAYLEAASNVIPFSAPSHGAFVRSSPSPVYFTMATLMEKIVGPLSAGSLRLASTDVTVNPIVRFNYFRNPGDVERCYVGPSLPADLSNDFLMREFCRSTVTTIWHYHEGCLVGKVVDRNFRVFGVDALKVVDDSTFTMSPSTNPQATLLMLGRSAIATNRELAYVNERVDISLDN